MIAPFWDDLNPDESSHGGNGDIYQYFDAANNRWILEFKDVAHYDRNAVRETFQTILLDPAYYPTPTGDGEIIFQYQVVADASGNTVGIENYPETDGIQYLFNNNYPVTAAPLNSNRALRFTTLAPVSNSSWLTLVSIDVNDSVGGNNNRIPEPGEGIQLVITLNNRGSVQAENVSARLRSTDGNATVLDSVAEFGTIPAQGQANNSTQPYFFQVSTTPSDTILDFLLAISATGYNATQYFAIGLNSNPGIVEDKSLVIGHKLHPYLECLPNPFSRATQIKWQIPNGKVQDLKIYDAAGKLVKSHKSQSDLDGFVWDGRDNQGRRVGSGIYFAALSFLPEQTGETKEGQKILVRKIAISR